MNDILYADGLRAGDRVDLGRHTITEAEILSFGTRWDPVFIHTDPDAAAASELGGVVASGLHTLAIYQRLAVRAFWSRFTGGIGSGFEIRFRRPVFPETTLTGHLTVRSVEPIPERGDAKVVITAELVDDADRTVLELTNRSVLPLRSGSVPG